MFACGVFVKRAPLLPKLVIPGERRFALSAKRCEVKGTQDYQLALKQQDQTRFILHSRRNGLSWVPFTSCACCRTLTRRG